MSVLVLALQKDNVPGREKEVRIINNKMITVCKWNLTHHVKGMNPDEGIKGYIYISRKKYQCLQRKEKKLNDRQTE